MTSPSNLAVHYSTGKDDWETPDDLFDTYNALFDFQVDAAANEHNHKCEHWFGPGSPLGVEDALGHDWRDYTNGPIWLNPPYSRGLQARFVKKAVEYKGELTTVMLLPARTDTRLFHDIIIANYLDVTFIKGRVRFVGAAQGAPFPSMIVIVPGA